MTIGEAAGLALKVHGAIWLAGAAAYYKYGDRTDLFEKAVRGNRGARQSIRDRIATDLGGQLSPVIRDATRVRSPLLNASGEYVERSTDVTGSEPFYQAIRDFVTASTGALLDYGLMLHTMERWRTWARRLSHCILSLVIFETVMLAAAVLVLVLADLAPTADTRLVVGSFVPTATVVVILLVCLALVHAKQGLISDLRERYDPEA